MKEITIYRVRRSFNDIKSQKGAFILYEAAVKVADKTGLCVFDGKGRLLHRGKRFINLDNRDKNKQYLTQFFVDDSK